VKTSSNGSHATRTEYVASELRERILDGRIDGGEPIRQLTVARELGVSQIPVREALLRLSAEGLVDFIPHKGAIASRLSVNEIRELTHLRVLIESDLLRAAIPNLKPRHLTEAEQVLEELEPLLESGSGVERWSVLNGQFHEALYRAANRPQSLEIVARLLRMSDRYIRLQLLLTDWIGTAEEEHRELLELCRKGQATQAARLLAQHIQEAGTAIAEVIATRGDAVNTSIRRDAVVGVS
jgi:DNA-binding GntR family transcriptional regulator